jgi:hypothetical protein
MDVSSNMSTTADTSTNDYNGSIVEDSYPTYDSMSISASNNGMAYPYSPSASQYGYYVIPPDQQYLTANKSCVDPSVAYYPVDYSGARNSPPIMQNYQYAYYPPQCTAPLYTPPGYQWPSPSYMYYPQSYGQRYATHDSST